MEVSSNAVSRTNRVSDLRFFGKNRKKTGNDEPERLRVCILIDAWEPVYEGPQVHVWELSKHLVENHNCLVDIYTRKLTGKQEAKFDKNESHLDGRLNIYRVGARTKPDNLLGKVVYSIIAPLKVKANYDLIHAHSFTAACSAKIIKGILRKPLVYTVHGIPLNESSETSHTLSSRAKTYLENFVLFRLRYDCEISVDHSIKDYDNVNKVVEVIPNGVDTSKFDIIESRKSDKFRILFVGKFSQQKGLEYLVEAAEGVVVKHPNVEFHLIGSGPMEEGIREKIAKSNLSDFFKLRGEIFGEDLILEYKTANAFVLPSIYEGQPLTLLEAWAAKLPVVATNVGGNKELIRNAVNGWLVEPRDPDALGKALNKVIEDEKRAAMGEAGYNLVKGYYSWERMTEKTFSIYRKLVKKK